VDKMKFYCFWPPVGKTSNAMTIVLQSMTVNGVCDGLQSQCCCDLCDPMLIPELFRKADVYRL